MPGIPWDHVGVAGGWLVAIGLTWLGMFAFVKGWIFASKQVDEITRPLHETIASLREERATLLAQNHALLRESVSSQNKFFAEIKSLSSKDEQP